jgi:2-phosphosulfolactate phosphatase
VIAELVDTHGFGTLSPEAEHAHRAWDAAADRFSEALHDCASGRELALIGFADDVAIASEVRGSNCVPIVLDDRFVDATSIGRTRWKVSPS